jgi:hypothetical protein
MSRPPWLQIGKELAPLFPRESLIKMTAKQQIFTQKSSENRVSNTNDEDLVVPLSNYR